MQNVQNHEKILGPSITQHLLGIATSCPRGVADLWDERWNFVIDCIFWLQSYVEEAPPRGCYSSRAWNLSESITQHMLPGCKGLTGRFTPRCLILKLYIIGAHLNQIEVLFTFLDSSSMKLDWNSGHSILMMKQRMVWWVQLQSKSRSAKGRFQEKRKGSGGGGRLTPA